MRADDRERRAFLADLKPRLVNIQRAVQAREQHEISDIELDELSRDIDAEYRRKDGAASMPH